MTTMEASVSFTDSTIFQHLFAARERFRQQNQHRHWSEEQLALEWTRICTSTGTGLGSASAGVGYAPEMPRTIPSWTEWPLGPSTDTTSDENHTYDMNRDQGLSTRSAPVTMAPSMSRGPSSRAIAKRSFSTFAGTGNPPASITRWQNETDVPFNNYTVNTHPGNARKRSRPMPPVVETTFDNPYDWIKARSESNIAIPPPLPAVNNSPALAQQDPTHLSVSVSTSTYSDRPLLDSPVPSTPVTDLTDASTTASTQMSRDLSTVSAFSTYSSSLPNALNEMHLDASTLSHFSPSDSDFKPLTQENLTAALSQFPNHLQSSKSCAMSGAAVQSSFNFSSSAPSATVSSDSTLSASHTAQPMKREDSNSSSFSSSSRSNQTRPTRRHYEQIENGKKTPIAPKVDVAQQESAPQMKRIVSADGSAKEAVQIPRKQPVQRQHREKLYCQYCNDHPEGFRGEHELQRHTNRSHARTRKVWICVDVKSQNPAFLAQCKACREGKRYGAYYNAAAHLRRTHFNPRKRGRKAKTEAEKRGGKGGGNWPAMDHLKEYWMKEIEELVTNNSPPVEFDTATEEQIADADADASMSDDDSEDQFPGQEPSEPASAASSLNEVAVWGSEYPVEGSAAASTAADFLSFDFSAATSSSQSNFEVTSFDQQFSMFDNSFNTVPRVDVGFFDFEESFSQPAPMLQEISAWSQ